MKKLLILAGGIYATHKAYDSLKNWQIGFSAGGVNTTKFHQNDGLESFMFKTMKYSWFCPHVECTGRTFANNMATLESERSRHMRDVHGES